MQQDKTFLGTEPVGQLLRRLAIPTVIAQLVNMLYNIVDRIYIGHIPEVGSLALTGVGVCLPIILIVSAFACFTASGGAPRASIYMGRDDMDSAEKTLGGCFTLQIGISVVLTAVLLLWGRKALLAFGASENTIDYAADYLHIYAFGTLFVELTLGMNAFITAQGFAKVGMYTVLIGAAANIVLDPIFIFALDMGVRGAALATVISQGVSCLWVVSYLAGKRSRIRLRADCVRFRASIVRSITALGVSPFTMIFTESAVQVVLNRGMMTYGGDMYVGTMTIIGSVVQLFTTPLMGYTNGVQPLMSYNYGAGRLERVRRTFRILLVSTLGFTMTYCALIELFPRVFIGLFTRDAALSELTVRGLRIYAAGLCIFGIQNATQSMFVGLGQAKISLVIAVMRKLVLLIPLALILPRFFGVTGVYLAEPVADVTSVIIATTLMLLNFEKILARRAQELAQHQS